MKKIQFSPGTSIERAAEQLVASAPACGTFSGIPIYARHATTQQRDIVASYLWRHEIRCIAYRHSPEGRRLAAEEAQDLVAKQAVADTQIAALDALDFSDCKAVLAWVDVMAPAGGRIGVRWDRAHVRETFMANGWGCNVNCYEDFEPYDPRNYAGWIVGQWLTGFADIGSHITDWRTSFGGTP
jgi:hypothetical protein